MDIKSAISTMKEFVSVEGYSHERQALQTLIDNVREPIDEGKIEKIIRDKFYSNMGVDASDMVLKQAKIKADMLSKDIAKAIVKELRG